MIAARQIQMHPEPTAQILIAQMESLLAQLKTAAEHQSFVKLPTEKPLTKQEAADHLRIEYKTLERKLSKGKLPAKLIHRVDGTMLFYASELNEFIKSK